MTGAGNGRRLVAAFLVGVLAGGGLVWVLERGDDGPPSSTPTAQPTAPSVEPPPPVHLPCADDELARLDHRDPAQGTLAFDEPFDGVEVDPARWRVRDATRLSFDQALISADNVEVAGGTLRITARQLDLPVERDGIMRHFTTGYLDTIGLFSQEYGRWEIRAKLPTEPGVSRGMWPAFWLRADEHRGEIDVLEAYGTPTTGPDTSIVDRYEWTVHEDTMHERTGRFSGEGRTDGEPLSGDFHTWAVDWSPTCLKFSMDDRTTGSLAVASAPWLTSSFASPVNIRLNLQVGSDYWGMADPEAPDQTRVPAVYEVDHVRVWARR